MNKKLERIVVCSAIVLIGLLAVGMMATPKPISLQQPPAPPPSRPPEQVVYSAFFHFVVDLQEQADELESEGKKSESLRGYVQMQAGLNDEEAQKLSEIALACVEEVSQQDAKALRLIRRFQSQFPGGKIPVGAKIPPPPLELKVLQDERDQIILAARTRLATTLGETGFDKLAKFAERRIAFMPQPVPSDRR